MSQDVHFCCKHINKTLYSISLCYWHVIICLNYFVRTNFLGTTLIDYVLIMLTEVQAHNTRFRKNPKLSEFYYVYILKDILLPVKLHKNQANKLSALSLLIFRDSTFISYQYCKIYYIRSISWNILTQTIIKQKLRFILISTVS